MTYFERWKTIFITVPNGGLTVKTSRIRFGSVSEDLTVPGRGTSSQKPQEIIDRIKPKVLKYFDDSHSSAKIKVKKYDRREQTSSLEPNGDELSFDVSRNTEENFCRRYYGYEYTRRNHPKAEGPVGPTRLKLTQ
jgi:hypothetical protein